MSLTHPNASGARPSGRFNVRMGEVFILSSASEHFSVKRPEGRAPLRPVVSLKFHEL
jgi:hypothetical protein